MGDSIYVSNVQDSGSVAAALQRAADAVLSATMVRHMLEGPRHERHQVEFLLLDQQHPALGSVSLELPEPGKTHFIFEAVIFQAGYFQDAPVIPPQAVSPLRVVIGQSERAFVPVVDRRLLKARLRAPVQYFQAYPHARLGIV